MIRLKIKVNVDFFYIYEQIKDSPSRPVNCGFYQHLLPLLVFVISFY